MTVGRISNQAAVVKINQRELNDVERFQHLSSILNSRIDINSRIWEVSVAFEMHPIRSNSLMGNISNVVLKSIF